MSVLLPTAIVKIQKAGDVPVSGLAAGMTDFYLLPVADQVTQKVGIVSACDVEFSTTADATAAIATFEVANLHPNTVRQIALAGYVKIEAGYIGHPTRAPQIIFFGRLDSYKYRLSSGTIKWTFTATAFPLEIWAIKPNAAQPVDNAGLPTPITVGEAIRILADRIGIGRANVRMPKIFDGDLSDTVLKNLTATVSSSFKNAITLPSWTTTRTAIDELQDLMKRVSQAVQITFGAVRNYSLLPDVNNPFLIVIDDVSKFTGESMNLDLDASQIIDAGPASSTSTTPPLDESTQAADSTGAAEATNPVISVPEYEVVSVFDPRVSMGLLVHGKSAKFGIDVKFKVHKGKHSLNGSPLRWRTEYSGQLEVDAVVSRGS